ncbi:hypothetical protein J6590_056203 [Homalodisca vitripennis]|nr:hypothetical protein J6590_056203 [Homalodisca vitripennis]
MTSFLIRWSMKPDDGECVGVLVPRGVGGHDDRGAVLLCCSSWSPRGSKLVSQTPRLSPNTTLLGGNVEPVA